MISKVFSNSMLWILEQKFRDILFEKKKQQQPTGNLKLM